MCVCCRLDWDADELLALAVFSLHPSSTILLTVDFTRPLYFCRLFFICGGFPSGSRLDLGVGWAFNRRECSGDLCRYPTRLFVLQFHIPQNCVLFLVPGRGEMAFFVDVYTLLGVVVNGSIREESVDSREIKTEISLPHSSHELCRYQ